MGHIRRDFEKMQIEFTCFNLRLCKTYNTNRYHRRTWIKSPHTGWHFTREKRLFFVQDTLKGRDFIVISVSRGCGIWIPVHRGQMLLWGTWECGDFWGWSRMRLQDCSLHLARGHLFALSVGDCSAVINLCWTPAAPLRGTCIVVFHYSTAVEVFLEVSALTTEPWGVLPHICY